jgi:hypothetical protein
VPIARRALALALLLSACVSTTEPEPLHDDVDRARETWLASRPANYRFEIAMQTSWFPKSGYYRVRVANGQVVETRDQTGVPTNNFPLTIDALWDQLLAARARGELNSARFDGQGVPREIDTGPWPVDGGVHYSVRNFETGG